MNGFNALQYTLVKTNLQVTIQSHICSIREKNLEVKHTNEMAIS
jgi:hypothetical protein